MLREVGVSHAKPQGPRLGKLEDLAFPRVDEKFVSKKFVSNGLQPNGDGLQPNGDGLQPNSGGLQPRSGGLQEMK